jgi:hypothetical protein
MKLSKARAGALMLTACMSGAAQAALHDRGGGLIYDDGLNITWLSNANYAAGSAFDDGTSTTDGLMTWQSAMSWAASLAYYDPLRNATYDDWRLPVSDFCFNYAGCTDSEMGHLYYLELGGVAYVELSTTHNDNYYLFQNIQNPINAAHWSSTEYSHSSSQHTVWGFDMDNGIQSVQGVATLGGVGYGYAWAVRGGDVAAVPEPRTYVMFLVGLGLVGFTAPRR